MQHGLLGLGLQRGHFRRSGNGELALRVKPRQHRVFDAYQLHGVQKLLEILALGVHREVIENGFLQTGRMEGDKIGLSKGSNRSPG